MTPRERDAHGPPPPDVVVDEPRWARIRGGVLAGALWTLDAVAIARQVREEAPHLLPLLNRMLTIPAEWTDAPRDADEFVSMLADLESVTTIVRRPISRSAATSRRKVHRRSAVARARVDDALARGAA